MNATPPRRIAFVINSLGPGGAERVLGQILQMTPPGAWDCHLILLDTEPEWRTPPDFVTVHRLDSRRRLFASIKQLRVVLETLEPQLAVSFLVRANVATVIAARSLGIPCIVSERSQLSTHLENEHRGLRRLAAKTAPRLTYPGADKVIAVSDGVRTDLVRKFGVKRQRVQTIYNPHDLEHIRAAALEAPEFHLPARFLASAGRLVKRKGFDDLLDAYALLKTSLPLCVLGEGADHGHLEARIEAIGLRGRVRLLGYARNPFAILGRADMFVSPSHCEGFPNAIAEAMVLGIPVVSTDCPSGPAELLDGVEAVGFEGVHWGKFGLLTPVGRPDLLARGIETMSNATTRSHYSEMARLRMKDFHIGAITAQYWEVFRDAVMTGFSATKANQPALPRHAVSGTGTDHA